MSVFQAKAFYNRVGIPGHMWHQGWYYELNEYTGSHCFHSVRGVFDSESEAKEAFKREIRGRKTMIKFDKLTLEEKEALLGFTVSSTGVSYDLGV